MGDLIQCPKCALRQTSRHAYCARCEHAFTGVPEEDIREDRSHSSDTPAPEGEADQAADRPPIQGEASSEGPSPRRADGFKESEAPGGDSVGPTPEGDRLARDQGSPSRRLSTPASAIPEASDTGVPLPSAPSWRMPQRQSPAVRLPEGSDKEPLEDEPTEERVGVPPRVGLEPEPSGRDFMVRGRPQGELYASERSRLPEDPLLADLVAGRVSKDPGISDEFALPVDWDQQLVRASHSGETKSQGSQPDGSIRRPSTLKKSQSSSGPEPRSSSGSGVPRTNPAAHAAYSKARSRTHPARRQSTHPSVRPWTNPARGPAAVSVPPEEGLRDTDHGDVPILEIAASGDVFRHSVPAGTGARAPGQRRRLDIRTTPGGELPAPPPESSLRGKEIFGLIGVVIVILFTVLALVDGVALFRAEKALTTILDEGIGPNGPTADLPMSLQRTLDELEVSDQVEAKYQTIGAYSNSYMIGVELKMAIAGYPVRWKAIREGYFDVNTKIRTLDVFVAAGWSLDTVARTALDDYETARTQRLQQDRKDARESQRKRIVGDDDSSVGDDVSAAPPKP